MTGFPWLPVGTRLPEGAALARLSAAGEAWQLCTTQAGGRAVLLLQPHHGADGWWRTELDALAAMGQAFEPVGDLLCLLLPAGSHPVTVHDVALGSPTIGRQEAEALSGALAAMAGRNPAAAWSSALFLDKPNFCLATELDPAEDRRAVLVAALSGGVRDPHLTPERIAALNPRLDRKTVAHLLEGIAAAPAKRAGPDPEGFTLPGQPALQALLREQVLDVLHRPQEYARLGVPSPAGVLLVGPPGCGKSFAAGRLAAFLGWPLHEIAITTVGSMWLHETPRRLAEAFDAAADEAPAIVLLEELDALGKSRGAGPAATEEVNTLLRLVEHAASRGLLVIGTTNRLEAIDPALRRRGRFDQVVVIDHPDAAGMTAMLQSLLQGRPHAPTLDLAAAARRLARRPASDAVWVVNEAARLAVRGGHDMIDDLLLARALQGLGA